MHASTHCREHSLQQCIKGQGNAIGIDYACVSCARTTTFWNVKFAAFCKHFIICRTAQHISQQVMLGRGRLSVAWGSTLSCHVSASCNMTWTWDNSQYQPRLSLNRQAALLHSLSLSLPLSLSLSSTSFLFQALSNTRTNHKWFCSWQLSVAIWGI